MRPLPLKLSGIPELALAPWWVVSARVADCGARDPRLERASCCVGPVPDTACGRVRCVPKLLSACWWTGADSSQLAKWPTVSWRRFQPASRWDLGLEGSRASADSLVGTVVSDCRVLGSQSWSQPTCGRVNSSHWGSNLHGVPKLVLAHWRVVSYCGMTG